MRLIEEGGQHCKRYEPADAVFHGAHSSLAAVCNFAKL
jgi:hypothetical protein